MSDAFFQTGDNLNEYGEWMSEVSLTKAANNSRIFPDVATNIDIKSEYNRSDYDYYRPSSRIPDDPIEIMKLCTKAYKKIGIVRNVIDLMSEFACKGIKLQHPVPAIQRFFEKWFEKVAGKNRSERFLNLLYREGNVIVKRTNGRIKNNTTKEWKKVRALEEMITKNEIPLKYDFISPTVIEVVGGDLAAFTGRPYYRLKLPGKVSKDIKEVEKLSPELLGMIPEDLLTKLKKNPSRIELDQAKLHVYHYKKDDWQVWADPMTYAIMDDLLTFEKMRLADMSALDGAISNIRLWRVGIIYPENPKASILPTRAGINKIRNMLSNNVGGGTMDLVVGPEVDFKESNTQVYRFLGSQKYEVTLNNIYDGMGIPPTLRSGAKGGNTGSFIALKTLVERLQYGRDVLTSFWQEQVNMVTKAMGFSIAPSIVFDKIILSDESVIFNILLQLADRDYLSMDSLLEKFDMIPSVEKARVRKETKQRGKKLPPKASPYHNPQWDVKIKEQMVLSGAISPQEIGIDVENFSPVNINGRPPNVVETTKRKKKPQGAPRVTAEQLNDTITWATATYKKISDYLTPCILSAYNKSNCRKLTNIEAKQAERLKLSALLAFEPFSEVSKEMVYNTLEQDDLVSKIVAKLNIALSRFAEFNQREPTLDELRSIYISIYVTEKLYG